MRVNYRFIEFNPFAIVVKSQQKTQKRFAYNTLSETRTASLLKEFRKIAANFSYRRNVINKVMTYRVEELNVNIEKHFKLRPFIVSCKSIALLPLYLFLSSCTNPNANSDSDRANYTFVGNWQGNGTDSEGTPFAFSAKVSHLGDNKYRMLILDKLDTLNKPMHIMDGELENNKFTYTADEGLYEGSGMLSEDLFEGYYKGPVDGTYKMWRIK